MIARNGLEVFIGDIWSFEKTVLENKVINVFLITSPKGDQVLHNPGYVYFECLDIKENKKTWIYFDQKQDIYTLLCRDTTTG